MQGFTPPNTEPGVCFPAVETHIMAQGLFTLEAQGLYLGREFHRDVAL